MIKRMLSIIIKVGIAAGIIGYMVYKGKLDFSIMATSVEYKLTWIVCFAVMFLNVLLTTFRWKILLEIKTKSELPLMVLTKLTWIGLFFSTVLPGIVTGDIVKLVYAKDLDNRLTKTYLLTSVLMDRIIGLIGLLFLLGIFSVIYYTDLILKGPQVVGLIHMNFLIFAGVIVFIFSLFLPEKLQQIFHKNAEKIPLVGKAISNVFVQVWLIGKDKKSLFGCLGLSACIQALNVFAFWYIVQPFITDVPLGLEQAYSFIPLGFVAMAIPISPAGIGVGHAMFEWLFSLFGVAKGASLFNLYFVCWITVNLLGVFAYIFGGKRYSIHDAEVFEHDAGNVPDASC